MNRFRRIVPAVVLLAILAAAVWALSPAPAPITISGKFSPADIAEIRALIKRDLQRNILSDFSWASFKRMPGNLKLRLRYEIASIHEALPNGAVVEIKTSHKSVQPSLLYAMRRGTNGWYEDKHTFIMESWGHWYISAPTNSIMSLNETNSTGVK